MEFETVVGIFAIFVGCCRITYVEHIELTSTAEFQIVDIVDCHRRNFFIHKRRLLEGAIAILVVVGIVVSEFVETACLGYVYIALECQCGLPRHGVEAIGERLTVVAGLKALRHIFVESGSRPLAVYVVNPECAVGGMACQYYGLLGVGGYSIHQTEAVVVHSHFVGEGRHGECHGRQGFVGEITHTLCIGEHRRCLLGARVENQCLRYAVDVGIGAAHHQCRARSHI